MMESSNNAQPQGFARNNPTRSRPPVKLVRVFPVAYDTSKAKSETNKPESETNKPESETSKPESETGPIDIFAIHGLDTESPKTWTWKENPKDSNKDGVNWLAHKDMLQKIAGPSSRIFTCDWPAKLFESREFAEHTFEELARLLLEGILDHHEAQRPILFIASCLGGIILMKALNMANDQYLSIKSDTRAIIFLSTPFRGTTFHEVAKWAEPGLRIWASSQGCRVIKWLEYTKRSIPEVAELIPEFTHILKEGHCEVSTFYEKGYTDLRRKIPILSSLLPSKKTILVNKESGTLDWDKSPLPLDRPHVQMNKFPEPEDPSYKVVARRIQEHINQIRKGTPDARIQRLYKEEKLKIVRLSGDQLDMAQCYINLAIIEQRKDRAKNAASQTSPFSLYNRLNIEAPSKNLLVELTALFSPCENPHDYTNGPRRILIHGRAGVGKTTLCKKIVHNFIYEKMWGSLFARVLWVPLRELKAGLSSYNLGNMFHRIYFNEEPKGKTFAETLWHAAKKTEYRDSLFILDGLDEISELLESGHPAYRLLVELFNCPNVIVTARPHARLPSDVEKFHRKLETIGFNLDQVHNYVQKVVQNPEKNAIDIKLFLRNHQLIQSLVRIPILLDALCLIWDENLSNSSIAETMTAIYDAIVQRLWKKKDIIRLHKLSEGASHVAHSSEIEERTESERKILECLAFSGMYSDVIEFQSGHRNDVRELVKFKDVVLDELLGNLSFLRSSDSSISADQQSYHFLHLTFQEFFAAKYFARQWKARKGLEFQDFSTRKLLRVQPEAFLAQEKYTGRYDIVWRFVAGLLQPGEVKDDNVQDDEVRNDSAGDFFEAIGRGPIDLVGPVHQRLVMRCLSEANTWKSRLRSDLESGLSQCLVLECDLYIHSHERISWELEFPENALLIALNNSDSQKDSIIDSLLWSTRYFSEAVVTILMGALEGTGHDYDRYSRVLRVLKKQSNLPETAISALVRMLGDRYSMGVRKNYTLIAETLGNQSNLSQANISSLTDILKDNSRHFTFLSGLLTRSTPRERPEEIYGPSSQWRLAADLLRKQSNLSEDTIAAIVELIDNYQNIEIARDLAAISLVGQQKYADAAILELVDIEKKKLQGRSTTAEIETNSSKPVIVELFARNLTESSINRIATKAIQYQKNWSGAAIAACVWLIENAHDIHYDVFKHLWNCRALPEDICTALVRVIENERGHYPKTCIDQAAQILNWKGSIPEDAATTLFRIIENERKSMDTRLAAAWAVHGRKSLLDIVQGGESLPETLVTALPELIKDKHAAKNDQLRAIELLKYQKNLPETAIEAFVRPIENESGSEDVQQSAAKSLGRQSNIPQTAVAALVGLLENERSSETTRSCVITAIGKRRLPDNITTALVRLLENEPENKDIRKAAVNIMESQKELSEGVITALVKLIESEDKNEDVRKTAIDIIGNQKEVSEEGITALTKLIKNKSETYRVRIATLSALGGQTDLSEEVITALVELIEGGRPSLAHLSIAVRTLGLQTKLSEEGITVLVTIIENKHGNPFENLLKFDYQIRCDAAKALAKQTRLTKETISALIRPRGLKVGRNEVARILGWPSMSNLSDMAIKAVQSTIDSGSIGEGLDLLKSLYGSFLYRGFREQLHLYFEEENKLIICVPDGSRIEIKTPHCQALTAITEGRQRVVPDLSKYSGLWPNYEICPQALPGA